MSDYQDLTRQTSRERVLKRWGTGLESHYGRPYWVDQTFSEKAALASNLAASSPAANLPSTEQTFERLCGPSKMHAESDPERSEADEQRYYDDLSSGWTSPKQEGRQRVHHGDTSFGADGKNQLATPAGVASAAPWVLVAPQIEEAIKSFAGSAGRMPKDEEIAQAMRGERTIHDLYRMLSLASDCKLATLVTARQAPVEGPGSLEWLTTRKDDQQLRCLRYEMQELFGETVHYIPPSEPLTIFFHYWSHPNEENIDLSFEMAGQDGCRQRAEVSIRSIVPYDERGLFDEPRPHIKTMSYLDGALPRGPFWELFGSSSSFRRDILSSYWFRPDLTINHRQREDRYCFKINS